MCNKDTQVFPLQKRAKAKVYSDFIAKRLCTVHYLTETGDLKRTPLLGSYISTLHCSNTIQVNELGKTQSKFCKQRWCIICNRIRSAHFIQSNKLWFDTSWEKFMLTLTVRNVKGYNIRATLNEFTKCIRSFNDLQRKKGKPLLKGIRKYEVTYNSERKDFHPHVHIICEGNGSEELMITYWLDYFNKHAIIKCQDLQPATNLIELAKYATKLIGKQKHQSTQRNKSSEFTEGLGFFPPVALDTIFQQLRNIRIFQRVGFTAEERKLYFSSNDDTNEDELFKQLESQTLEGVKKDIYEWKFCFKNQIADWFNSSGVPLSNFKLNQNTIKILSHNEKVNL